MTDHPPADERPASREEIQATIDAFRAGLNHGIRLSYDERPDICRQISAELGDNDVGIYRETTDWSKMEVVKRELIERRQWRYGRSTYPANDSFIVGGADDIAPGNSDVFRMVRVSSIVALLEVLEEELHSAGEGPQGPMPPFPPDSLTNILPSALPQHTFPELKAAIIAMADGPIRRRWSEVEGEVALRHEVKGVPLGVKFVASPLVQWLGMPNTIESLYAELRRLGLSAALLYHVCVDLVLEHQDPTITLDQLIAAIGWEPRSTDERWRMRRTVWRWLVVFASWVVIGKRRARHPDPITKQPIDLTVYSEMLLIPERAYPERTQLALDDSIPPHEIMLEAGPWLRRWRGRHDILWYFGDVRRLAAIPAGKPSGAWAQAVGLALNQSWRERSARAEVGHVGEENALTVRFHKPFTRRDLLDLFPPSPTVWAVLEGPHPKRAQSYWNDAMVILKQQKVVGHYAELAPLLPKRQGWAEDWLDQPLDIRPAIEGKQAVAEIAKRAASARRARTKKKAAS